jgi:hypothetical protein
MLCYDTLQHACPEQTTSRIPHQQKDWRIVCLTKAFFAHLKTHTLLSESCVSGTGQMLLPKVCAARVATTSDCLAEQRLGKHEFAAKSDQLLRGKVTVTVSGSKAHGIL